MKENQIITGNSSDFKIEDGKVSQDSKEIIFEAEKEKPEIEFQDVDLDQLEADEALGELFEKISPLTIPSVIIGIIFLIISFTNKAFILTTSFFIVLLVVVSLPWLLSLFALLEKLIVFFMQLEDKFT